MACIKSASKFARPYSGNYTASWLLSEYEDLEWVTSNGGREENIDGKWKNVVRVNWGVHLPNGDKLTDPKYNKLLDLNRRIAFLIRLGLVNGTYAVKPWRAAVAVLLQFTSWIVLHEEIYKPEIYGFKLVEQDDINVLLAEFSEGGWIIARQVPERLLACLYLAAFGSPCPQNLYEKTYDLPDSVRHQIIKWLVVNEFYGKVVGGSNKGKLYVKRSFLADLINESMSVISAGCTKFYVFCRQFEPDFNDGSLLLSIHQKSEFPSHKIMAIGETNEFCSESSLQSVCTNLSIIFSAYRHAPDLLPNPCSLSIKKAEQIVIKKTRVGAHHRFIPMDVGFEYLNEAFRFVHVYGEAIIDYYLSIGPSRPNAVSDKSIERNNTNCEQLAAGFPIMVGGKAVPIAEVLNIKGFQHLETIDFNLMRKQPTLSQVLRVLIGACIICIAMMKPSRDEELIHLKRNCLRHNREGYYLHFSLGKSNVGEAYQSLDKPIPVIAATAIKLLQKLGSGLVVMFGDEKKISNNLFYLPKLLGKGARKADAYLLNIHIDMFCDYVSIPPDNLGRRWYIRIHEMRKWFLLLLFWSGRFDVLDAARWIAWHSDITHIYAYIEREFPGQELPALEAEYAVERLRALESSVSDEAQCEQGLCKLYELVLSRFRATSLSMVPDSDWIDYISSLRKAGGFTLEPHSVFGVDGTEIVGLNVSFVLREIINE